MHFVYLAFGFIPLRKMHFFPWHISLTLSRKVSPVSKPYPIFFNCTVILSPSDCLIFRFHVVCLDPFALQWSVTKTHFVRFLNGMKFIVLIMHKILVKIAISFGWNHLVLYFLSSIGKLGNWINNFFFILLLFDFYSLCSSSRYTEK